MSEVVKFNNRNFIFECGAISNRITNSSPDPKIIPISFNAIGEIVINDSLFDPFLDATLTLKTTNNGLEATPLLNFEFFANNNNTISFKIEPEDTATLEGEVKGHNIIGFRGIICHSDAYGPDTSVGQLHFFKLTDYREAILRQTKLAAIQIPKVDVNYNISQNIDNITRKVLNIGVNAGDEQSSNYIAENDTGGIKFDYVYPNHFNAFDAINFLIPYNITDVGELPIQNIFKYNYTFDIFGSIPITQVFQNPYSGESNLETFIIGEDQIETNSALNTNEAPRGPNSTILLPDNKINNIAYNNIHFDVANNDLLPICVMNTVNPLNVVSMVYIDLEEQIKLFDKNIIKDNLAQLYGRDVKLNIDIDQSKTGKQNYKIFNTNFNIDTAVKVAKAQLYNSFIFQNMYMTITTKGQPYREPGKFININKQQNLNTGSAADRKLIGQWLVTEVKHIFTGNGTYTNVIQCVKPFVNK